jgi:hypothetical protein
VKFAYYSLIFKKLLGVFKARFLLCRFDSYRCGSDGGGGGGDDNNNNNKDAVDHN